jgi:hypothetical protein
MEVGNESKIVRYFISDRYLSTLLLRKNFSEKPGRPPYPPSIRRASIDHEEVVAWRCERKQGDPPHKPFPARFHVDIRRENSSIRPPKRHFLSFSTYFSPSGKRSAIQKRLLAYISEPDLCRIQLNGARFAVFRNVCAGIP